MMDVVQKLAEGNPGAITVCMRILQETPQVDPDCGAGFLPLLHLDSQRIYGSRIWMLYKDVCKQDIVSTLGMIRAVQLGYLPETELNHAIDNYGRKLDGSNLDVEGLLAEVKTRLPNFGK